MSITHAQLEGSVALERAKDSPIQVNHMSMIEMAVAKGADIETITKLLDLKERFDATEARKAFVEAMASFKRSSIRIVKDKDNAQYKSKYVSLGNLVNTVTPFLSDNNLSARWDIDQSSGIKVTCIITHSMGHSESVSMTCPPDKSGAKNPIQEIKSAITYAKAATFESICGLASTDANRDDDGNGAGPGSGKSKEMDLDEFDRLSTLISEAPTVETLQAKYLAAAADAKQLGDKTAANKFNELKNKRYRELK